MRKPNPPSQDELFDYAIDPTPLAAPVTGYAGLPLVLETFRALGGAEAVERHLPVKQRQRGFSEVDFVESFLALLAAGGECPEDFAVLREDAGLAQLVGRPLPSPTPARQFLYAFHDEARMAQRPARDQAKAWVPDESAALQGLAAVGRAVTHEVVRQAPELLKQATLDMDASIIESAKREAYPHYDGGTGYQPEVVLWVEADQIVADEFRDGNVPAGMNPLGVVQRGFQALPEGVKEYRFRGDSACYEHDLLNWLRDEHRAGGPAGRITFGISADMSKELRRESEQPHTAWGPLLTKDGQLPAADASERREVAEVAFTPEGRGITKQTPADRYLVVRVTPQQGQLFLDGSDGKYFALVTNHDGSPSEVVHWHREKAGTVEHVHHVLKNELGAGTLPCGRFGANAAWFRLNALTYNVLSALKRLALPEAYHKARPKKLRFHFLCVAGKLARHAGQRLLRLAAGASRVQQLREARRAVQAVFGSRRRRQVALLACG